VESHARKQNIPMLLRASHAITHTKHRLSPTIQWHYT
jgi:hypothetical protein